MEFGVARNRIARGLLQSEEKGGVAIAGACVSLARTATRHDDGMALPKIDLPNLLMRPAVATALLIPHNRAWGAPLGADRERVWRIVRRTLGVLLGLADDDLLVERTAEGKPFLRQDHPFWFNVSHGAACSLLAVSRTGEIGCDIEDRFTGEDVSALCPLILHPQEQEAMVRLAVQDRAEAFRRYWVRKEAVLKAAGSGFLTDPRHLITGQEDRHAKWTSQPGPSLFIHNQSVDSGCAAAVASMDAGCVWAVLGT